MIFYFSFVLTRGILVKNNSQKSFCFPFFRSLKKLASKLFSETKSARAFHISKDDSNTLWLFLKTKICFKHLTTKVI